MGFPHRDLSFPHRDMGFPHRDLPFPRLHMEFPRCDLPFPRLHMLFPRQQMRFINDLKPLILKLLLFRHGGVESRVFYAFECQSVFSNAHFVPRLFPREFLSHAEFAERRNGKRAFHDCACNNHLFVPAMD